MIGGSCISLQNCRALRSVLISAFLFRLFNIFKALTEVIFAAKLYQEKGVRTVLSGTWLTDFRCSIAITTRLYFGNGSRASIHVCRPNK